MRVCAALVAALSVAAADQVQDDQRCELCGLLVWRLEGVMQSKEEELKEFIKERSAMADRSSKAHTKRWIRSEYPVALVEAFEEYTEKAAEDSMLTSTVCRGQDGNDKSALRNPYGAPYQRKDCTARVKAICSNVVDEYVDEIMDAAVNKLTASECGEIVPGCKPKRAKLLLGPMYSKSSQGGHHRFMSAGVKDVWRESARPPDPSRCRLRSQPHSLPLLLSRPPQINPLPTHPACAVPGLEPYYLNQARHISQHEPPKGWDPKGPKEQEILLEEDEDNEKEEL